VGAPEEAEAGGLTFNGTAITTAVFNGVTLTALWFNGTQIF
jgi:hypothetical protein